MKSKAPIQESENRSGGALDSTSVDDPRFLQDKFRDSELVIGFVGAVGVELRKAEEAVEERLQAVGYQIVKIGVTQDVMPTMASFGSTIKRGPEFDRISNLMDLGNQVRERSANNAVLALGVAAFIAKYRNKNVQSIANRTAFIVHSLKRPEEVRQLREIYSRGFYLIGVHASPESRRQYLVDQKMMSKEKAQSLMDRDMNEGGDFGQRIVDTFHLSDFFLRLGENDKRLTKSAWRIVDLMFSNPFCTPTFGEHAMFLAFTASLRSADLSRQVGAVIAKDGEVLAMGANECPKPGGGLYWPVYDQGTRSFQDIKNGRDFVRGRDSNKQEQIEMIEEIADAFQQEIGMSRDKIIRILKNGPISDLTEFGRVVHAEMEALLSCARKGISPVGATMYCTTFPCHNCAKHIIAAGIDRVVFIEPYLKSKAFKLHNDALKMHYPEEDDLGGHANCVEVEPFVGVGPRRFFELFSMQHGVGRPIRRKKEDGTAEKWKPDGASLRIQMLPRSYIGLEQEAASTFQSLVGAPAKVRTAKRARRRTS